MKLSELTHDQVVETIMSNYISMDKSFDFIYRPSDDMFDIGQVDMTKLITEYRDYLHRTNKPKDYASSSEFCTEFFQNKSAAIQLDPSIMVANDLSFVKSIVVTEIEKIRQSKRAIRNTLVNIIRANGGRVELDEGLDNIMIGGKITDDRMDVIRMRVRISCVEIYSGVSNDACIRIITRDDISHDDETIDMDYGELALSVIFALKMNKK